MAKINTEAPMYTLPQLDYSYDALEDSISAEIMELHYDKHHRTYVDKLNTALEKAPEFQDKELVELLANLDALPEEIRTAVRNNGGGHYNHSLFWKVMSPDGGGKPSGELLEDIEEAYGSFDEFVEEFSDKAAGVFGSGWVWLMPDMSILTSPNQDSPIMEGGPEPILGLDVWEHAYYLDYKNKRPEYIDAWWNVVNWDEVARRLERL